LTEGAAAESADRFPLSSMAHPVPTRAPSLLALPLLLLAAACTTVPPAAPGGGKPAAGPAAPAATPAPGGAPPAPGGAPGAPGGPGGSGAAAPAPGTPRAFADVIKDAKRSDGLIATWQKDERVWLELKAEDFGKPFILSPKIKSGIGEAGLFGGLMGEEALVEFRRVHNVVQLVQRNTAFYAAPNTPTGRSVDAAFSPSLLGSVPVASQPHPERKTVLVEANGLFLSDLLGYGMQLQRRYRQGYNLDGRNSSIAAVRATPELLVIETLQHYATNNIAVPTPGSPPGAPVPSVPRSLPDARSLFLGLHYSLARLPDVPMAARRTDPRVGYFFTGRSDFSDDLARTPRQRSVIRWRLEKKEPDAALSEPVKPITFWIDRTVPVKYRPPIVAGILEWNKAFEKIGFKDAVRVEIQPDDADWDTLDFGRASVRWMTNADPAFGAIGPSHVDPRSGEILDADIGVESLSSRNLRAARSQLLASPLAAEARPDFGAAVLREPREWLRCTQADGAFEQMNYALDVLAARGELAPDGPEAEAFVAAYLKDMMMHEVGHTLGLRHNFRASRVYSPEQVADPAFAGANGLAGSVMDYLPINLPPPGVPFDRAAAPFTATLGPYDYWAIEYAYKPIAPGQEEAELQRIAGRSGEPLLAYGTDEDMFLGIDPESLHFDLGADPVAFVKKRIAVARDLLARQESRSFAPGDDYTVLRRVVGFALRDLGRSAGVVARQVGGVRTLRDRAGTGRDPLTPVPAAQQRAALDVLAKEFLAPEGLRLSPQLQRRLAVDFEERTDAVFRGDAPAGTDFSPRTAVLDLQRALLNQLMGEGVAVRLLDSETKAPQDALRLRELYARLDAAVWSELPRGGEIAGDRRELQREHVNRLAALLLRPQALPRADARALVRAQAQALRTRIEAAARRAPAGGETRAHLQDSADTLAQALEAKPARVGV
jgi:hypothetical protein